MRVSKFLKDLMTTGASQVAVILFGVVLLRIMASALDEKHFGLFILIRRWIVVLLPIVTLNLSIGLARYVSFEKEKARYYLHISLIITSVLTVLIFVVLTLFNKLFSTAFFNSNDYINLVFLLAFFLFANMIHLITYSYFRGKMDMNSANIMRLLFMGFPVLLAGLLFILGINNYSTILLLYFSIYTFWGVIISLYYLKKECSITLFKSIFEKGAALNFKESLNVIKYSLVRVPSLIFISLIFSFPVFYANYKISITAAGYIGIVVSVLHLLTIFSMPFNLIFLPKFSSLIKNNLAENIKNYSMIILDFIFTFLPIVVVMLFGLTRYIVLLWFGPKYLVTVDGVAASILASVFYLGYALIRGVLDGLYEFPFINIINLAGLLTVAVLSLVMRNDIFELSAALCFGLFIMGISSIFILVKKLQLSLPWMRFLIVLVGCGVLFLLLTVADNRLAGLKLNTWYKFALCISYRGILFVLAWWFYWRKTLWYTEILKRINIKVPIKEDVTIYEE
jgi:O-antigen/teichoic acid export membrane protein